MSLERLLTAMEWGFRASEKGWNLDRSIQEFHKLYGFNVLPSETGWRDIESAPKDHEGPPILTFDGEVHLTTRGFTAQLRRAGWFDERGMMIHPTHWMPLPSVPASLSEEKP